MNLTETYGEMYKQLAKIYSQLDVTKNYLEIVAPDSNEVGNPVDYFYHDVRETIDKVAGAMYCVETLERKAEKLQL